MGTNTVSLCAKLQKFALRRGCAILVALAVGGVIPSLDLAGCDSLGPQLALATSGAPPVRPGINGYNVSLGATELAVANDGFFVISVWGSFASDAEILASLDVRVTTASGASVAGSLRAIPSDPKTLYWTANEPLPDATYVATISAPSSTQLATSTVQLHASGARAPLTNALIEPVEWFRYHELTGGKQVTCQTFNGPITIGELEQTRVAVGLRISQPPINGQVLWITTVDPLETPDTKEYNQSALFRKTGDEDGGQLFFEPQQTEYCFVASTQDLRDDKEVSAPTQCWTPANPTDVDETGVLERCTEPPSVALTQRWCKAHPESTLRVCSGGWASPSTAGASGSGAHSPAQGTDDASGTSSSCSVGYSQRGIAVGGGALLVLALALARRRRGNSKRL